MKNKNNNLIGVGIAIGVVIGAMMNNKRIKKKDDN